MNKLIAKIMEVSVFSMIFLLGIVFVFLSPPLQKPDEHTHFRKSVAVSKGYVFCRNGLLNYPLESKFSALLTDPHTSRVEYHKEIKYPSSNYRQPLFSTKAENATSPDPGENLCILSPLPYIPHAVGLFAARILNLSAVPSFFLGRLVMFLLSFVWVIYLYRKTPKPYNYFILFVYALPMTLHQLSAYSYDSLHIMLGLTLFAEMIILMQGPLRRGLVIYVSTLVLFIFTKPGYELIVLSLFAIPPRHIARKTSDYFIRVGCALAVLILFFAVSRFGAFQVLSSHVYPKFIYPALQLRNIISFPVDFASILLNTTWIEKKLFLQSLIGILGWLDYSLDKWVYLFYGVIAGYLIIGIPPRKKATPSPAQLAILLTVVLGLYVSILLSLYLVWNPVGGSTASGAQGRYFTVLVPFIMLFLHHVWHSEQYKKIAFFILTIAAFFSITHSVWQRYFDYSKLLMPTNIPTSTGTNSFTVTPSHPLIQKIRGSNRKLAGVDIYFSPTRTVKPYIASLKSEDCRQTLSHSFIDLTLISNRPYRLLFKGLKTEKNKGYCLTIASFDTSVAAPLQIELDDSAHTPLIVPVYYQ